MCNAFNHPPGCVCGWGGEGHAGNCGPGQTYFEPLRWFSLTVASYINPNAKCPVCGAAVYFYRSPDDGRVFFDELGPPWPKRACTSDSDRCRPYLSLSQPTEPQWQLDGWQPFLLNRIERVPGFPNWLTLQGFIKGARRTLYVNSPLGLCLGPAHVRELDDGQVAVSLLHVSETNDITAYELRAYKGIRIWRRRGTGQARGR